MFDAKLYYYFTEQQQTPLTDPPECEHVFRCALFVTEHAVCLLWVEASSSASGPVPSRRGEKVQIVAEECCNLYEMKTNKPINISFQVLS